MNKKMISVILVAAFASAGLFFFIKKSPIVTPEIPPQEVQIVEIEASNLEQENNTQKHREIETAQQLTTALDTQRPLVMKFYANWCGACNYVNGFYEELAQEMPEVDFYSVNVDNQALMQEVQAQNVSKEGIEYLPTFVVIHPGKVHTQFTGGRNKEDMKKTIKETLN